LPHVEILADLLVLLLQSITLTSPGTIHGGLTSSTVPEIPDLEPSDAAALQMMQYLVMIADDGVE
jgi:hypothetical protein